MGEPFPVGYVALFYDDAAAGGAAGVNAFSHIAIRPKYDVDDDSNEARFAPLNLAHEVAHWYWRGNADWMDEGPAELLAAVVENARTGQEIRPDNAPCWLASTIAELENADVRGDHDCNYSLGERLFIDLALELGSENFKKGFRALYLSESIDGERKGIAHVFKAFKGATARAVIARWYDGTAPYNTIRFADNRAAQPALPAFNGEITKVFVSIGEDETPVTEFSSDIGEWVWLELAYTYDVPEDSSLEIQIVEYFEDGFVFKIRSKTLNAKTRYAGMVKSVSIGRAPPNSWAAGVYTVYVYVGETKIAEVEYEVTAP